MKAGAEFVSRMAAELEPARSTRRAKKSTRAKASARGKHIGGYFDKETVERIALLRARLELDNTQLLELAIDDLWRKHSSKRAFGD
jgi:hypothetical protein